MTEYFTIETEPTDDPDVMVIYASENLSTQEEIYRSAAEGDEGSTIAQTLFNGVDGIRALTIKEDMLIVSRHADAPWEMLIDEIRDVLRDFFL